MSQPAISCGVAGLPKPYCSGAADASTGSSNERERDAHSTWTLLTSPVASTRQVWIALL